MIRKKGRGRKAASRRRNIGDEIAAGLREALAFGRGELADSEFRAAPLSARRADAVPAPEFTASDVTSIRNRLGLSQAVFARLLNVSTSTARSWEQGVNRPGGAASRLLQVAQDDPRVLLRFVRRAKQASSLVQSGF